MPEPVPPPREWVICVRLGVVSGRRGEGKGRAYLETLQAVAPLRLLTNDIHHLVDELSAFGVVTLGPVISGGLRHTQEVSIGEQRRERNSDDVRSDQRRTSRDGRDRPWERRG